MTFPSFLFLLLGAAGAALAVLVYLRVEPPVAGRAALLALRVGALALLALILVNPAVPGTQAEGPTAAPGAPWVLLDPDLSLAARSDEGRSLWDIAVERAVAEARRGAPLAVLGPPGSGPEGVDTLTLRGRSPIHPTDDLLDGIRRLAEAGADTVRVLGTFRGPPQLVERLREAAPVPLVLERVGGPVRNAGIAELDLPSRVRAGEEVEGRVVVFAEGVVPGDSAEVEVRARGELIRSFRIPLPGTGSGEAHELRLPAADTGAVRYAVRVRLEGDRFPPDDERARRVRIGEPEGGVFLVSLRPDWEPRTLLPVLEAVTGLDAEGFLGVAEDGFLPLVREEAEIRPEPAEAFRARLSRARLLVLHGAEEEVPGWLREAVAGHPRVIHLPRGRGGAALAGMATGVPGEGEWTVDPDVPPTSVSPFVTGISLAGLPPLSRVLPLAEGQAGTIALRARGARAQEPVPVLVLREGSEGRRAVALAQGFWRWGSRAGEGRRAYRGLWAGVADWLLARPGTAGLEGVRPAELVQPRGRPLRWIVAPDLREVELSLTPAGEDDDAPAFRGTLEPDEDGRAATPAVPPGIYRYDAGPFRGTVEVEGWAPSLSLPPLEVPEELAAAERLGISAGPGAGRRLRTHPLPYFLVLLFLCAEWVGRRRVGLR